MNPYRVNDLVHRSSIAFHRSLAGKVRFDGGHRQLTLTISISPSLLNGYLKGRCKDLPNTLRDVVEGSESTNFYHRGKSTRPMRAAIEDLLTCPFAGSMKQLYVESKALELIVHKLDRAKCADAHSSTSGASRSHDLDRIVHATKILLSDLEKSPGLFDLAKAVGTNHTQLNSGFKKVYGTTVFGHLRHMRLEKARRLMEESGMNVTQAALTVGYSSIPSFSRAFSTHFGANPMSFAKKRLQSIR